MLVVAFLYSISVNFDKEVVTNSSPVFASAVTLFFLGMAFLQLENAALANAQYKAEALAIGAGSAINHFLAINPDDGELRLSLGDVLKRSARVGQPGWPDVFSLNIEKCMMRVSIDEESGSILLLNFTVHRVESGYKPNEYVSAAYPLVSVSGDDETEHECSETLVVDEAGAVSYA